MSKNPDVNSTFVGLAGLIMAGGLISAFTSGSGMNLLGAFVIIYVMLIITNAISRGEKSRGKRGAR